MRDWYLTGRRRLVKHCVERWELVGVRVVADGLCEVIPRVQQRHECQGIWFPQRRDGIGKTFAAVRIRTPSGSPTGTAWTAEALPCRWPVPTGAELRTGRGNAWAARCVNGENASMSRAPARTSDTMMPPGGPRRPSPAPGPGLSCACAVSSRPRSPLPLVCEPPRAVIRVAESRLMS